MENASKALIIAGGVLVSIIILSLLVTFYSSIRNLQETKQDVEASEQSIEFNKQYDAYYKDKIYGSEFLSLINKVCDYNKKYVKDIDEGYAPIKLTVDFKNKKDIVFSGYKDTWPDHTKLKYDNITLESGSTINENNTGLKDAIDSIEKALNNFENSDYQKYTDDDGKNVYISLTEILSLRTATKSEYGKSPNGGYHSELSLYLQNHKNITEPGKINHIIQDREVYQSLKSQYTQFKNKTFKAKEFIYDSLTGKISDMKFEET